MGGRLVLATLVLLLGALVPAAAAADDPLLAEPGRCGPAATDPAAHHRLQRVAMHCLVAEVRERAGLPPLRASAALRRSATYKARSIAACKRFTHTPCGEAVAVPFRRARVAGHDGWRIGEDLAWGTESQAAPRAVLARWLASPAHRRVLLDARFARLGLRRRRVRLLDTPVGSVLWVAHLGQR